mgnify:CR=1 FL=1|tara:strand:+ start:2575 stop:3144 length:570 start_codon:yes stop_codon:yes gene_type:complete
MIRIALVGSVGSGKTFISKLFGYPVFNADKSVAKIYSKNKRVLIKLKKNIPNFFTSLPIKKKDLIKAIVDKEENIKKISKIVHPEVRKDLRNFIKKNKRRKIVVLDIPLFLENRLNKKDDIIIFIQSPKEEVFRRIKKRKNFNRTILRKLEELQLPLGLKKRKSKYIIKNNFNKNYVYKNVKNILSKIL